MKTKILLLLVFMVPFMVHPIEIMKLSEVKAGMDGEGKTIFKGTTIENFKFKVLGIMENFVPAKNLILVELFSPELKDGGVVAGMSGSPAYINGRLIGSVSYGFPFSRKPIAGVTPIEDILKTVDYNQPAFTVDISNIRVDFSRESVQRIAELLQQEMTRRMTGTASSQISPIQLLSTGRGLQNDLLKRFLPVLTPMQDLKIKPNLKEEITAEKMTGVSPADAVSIPLVRGDFEYSSSGTVTHIDDKNIYIFGHPFFNLGTVDFPLHKAEVISVVPTYDNPFRLVSTKRMIGLVRQDRFSAVQGELGKTPYMIPTRIFIKNRNRVFKNEMVSHSLLTPSLIYVTLMSVFSSEFQDYGFQSIEVDGKIFIENEENVQIANLFTGTTACDDFSNLVLAVNFYLMNNMEKKIKIQKMDFEINAVEKVKRIILENVLLEKNSFHAGELMKADLLFRDETGQTFTDSITLKAPNLNPDSIFYLLAGDARSLADFDSKVVKSEYFPDKVSLLIRAINNIRKNNRLYFKLYIPVEGFFMRGFEFPHLPFSLRNVMSFNTTSREHGNVAASTLAEYQMEVPGEMTGKKVYQLKIKERKNEN